MHYIFDWKKVYFLGGIFSILGRIRIKMKRIWNTSFKSFISLIHNKNHHLLSL